VLSVAPEMLCPRVDFCCSESGKLASNAVYLVIFSKSSIGNMT
jgi:hypothetical protein